MKTFAEFFSLFSLITIVLAKGELSIVHSPNGISFKGNDPVNSKDLPNIFYTAIGHSTQAIVQDEENMWKGLTIDNPFNYPGMMVVVAVDGLYSLQLNEPRYPVSFQSGLQQVKDDFTFGLGQIVFDENDLYSGNTLKLNVEKLDVNKESVADFVKDMGVLKDLTKKILSKMQLGNVWIQLKGLKKIVHEYGQDSEETAEAVNLLKVALDQLETNLDMVYGDKFLLAAITDDDITYLRSKRSTLNSSARTFYNGSNLDLNLSKHYSEEYASIFNIILWTSVFLIAALISTAVFICTLDPGRDSIIYRMTTQRIKKDN